MTWINEHKNEWRLISLVLFVIAMAGPWTYDLINVPAEFACSAPYIRLQGDYCGMPHSGMGILPGLIGDSFNLAVNLVSGSTTINILGQRFIISLRHNLPLSTLLSTLALILRKNQNQHRISLLVVWSLAAISILSWSLILPDQWRLSPLWGYWLYVGLAVSMLVLEAVLAARKGSASITRSANQ